MISLVKVSYKSVEDIILEFFKDVVAIDMVFDRIGDRIVTSHVTQLKIGFSSFLQMLRIHLLLDLSAQRLFFLFTVHLSLFLQL